MKPVYCDESVWIPVAKGLRKRNWTIYTASEQDNLELLDKEQLEKADENNWILFTFDDDFLTLVKKQELEHSGIIYVNQTGKRVSEVITKVDQALQNHHSTNQIHYL